MKTLTVFGLGYVGLTTALGFCNLGNKVYGVDVDPNRRKLLTSGTIPFSEPMMDGMLKKHIGKKFIVTDDVKRAVSESDYIFYCVGTPCGNDGSADLKNLHSAIDSTIDALQNEKGETIDGKTRVMVIKSTVPPSTTSEEIVPYVKAKGPISSNLLIANNPEFLREGHCWDDFVNADRIVVGIADERAKAAMTDLYGPMDIPMFFVSYSTGEFIKYLSNGLLATMISYSNEMANVADTIGGIDVSTAFKILHMDKRWNDCDMTSYVYPGCGYGGYCLPKDTCALYEQSKSKGFEPSILREVIRTNSDRPLIIAKRIMEGSAKSSIIGFLGLSFKPGSNDVRETPAAKIIAELRGKGYDNIIGYDPIATNDFVSSYPGYLAGTKDSMESLYRSSDVVVIATAWPEFKGVNGLGDKRIIDCRYIL